MDVHIGEMTSSVRAVDGQSLLAPEVLDRIVRVTLARLREEQDRAKRGNDDTALIDAPSSHGGQP
jgi:hypothetical protein